MAQKLAPAEKNSTDISAASAAFCISDLGNRQLSDNEKVFHSAAHTRSISAEVEEGDAGHGHAVWEMQIHVGERNTNLFCASSRWFWPKTAATAAHQTCQSVRIYNKIRQRIFDHPARAWIEKRARGEIESIQGKRLIGWFKCFFISGQGWIWKQSDFQKNGDCVWYLIFDISTSFHPRDAGMFNLFSSFFSEEEDKERKGRKDEEGSLTR